MFAAVALVALGVLSPFGAALTVQQPRATVCNGHSELCSRSYSNVTYIGAHDSYSVDTDPLDLAANQNIAITAQLNLGVRLLQSQAHFRCINEYSGREVPWSFAILLLYDGGSLQSYLTTVKTWLDANPNEVVTLVVTNGDNLSVSQYWVPAFTASGIVPYTYVPPSGTGGKSNWPTLSSMIDSGKRLVVFMDYNSDTTAAPYILPEFNNIWETKYDVTDSTFPCTVDRGSNVNMLMINHFLDVSIASVLVPDRVAASTTNGQTSIVANANGCLSLNGGANPTFVLLDFVDKGTAIAAGNALNHLS